jgi:hypothetical protein
MIFFAKILVPFFLLHEIEKYSLHPTEQIALHYSVLASHLRTCEMTLQVNKQ